MGKKRRLISCQYRQEQRLKYNWADYDPEYSSRDSTSSDGTSISTPSYFSVAKRNSNGVRRFPRDRRNPVYTVSKNKKRSSASRVKQRKFPVQSAASKNKDRTSSRVKGRTLSKKLSECNLNCRNHPPIPLYLSTLEQNVHDIRTLRRQPDGCSDDSSKICGNYLSTPLYSPTLEQNVHDVHPFQGQSGRHIVGISGSDNILSISESLEMYANFKHPLPTSVAFNDPPSYLSGAKKYSDNIFQSEEQIPCSYTRTSKQPASSGIQKLVSDCIRNSYMPRNINKNLVSSTISSSQRSYSHSLNFCIPQSTPNDHSAVLERDCIKTISQSINPIITANQMTNLQCSTTSHSITKHQPVFEERIISPCSTLVEVGSMETILENRNSSSSTTEPLSLTDSSPSELILHAPPNTPTSNKSDHAAPNTPTPNTSALAPPNTPTSNTSEISSKESWDSEDSTKSINQPAECFLDSNYLTFKGNFSYPKSVSGRNGENYTSPKNENSSKTSIFPVQRQNLSQIQIHVSPSSTVTSPLWESKHIENDRATIQTSPYSDKDLMIDARIRASNNSKAKNVFQKYISRSNTTLASNDSGIRSSPHLKETISQQVGEFLSTFSPVKLLLRSEERYRTETPVENVSQSFAAMSMTCGLPTTDASEMAISSNEPNSEQSAYSKTKTRKKSKLISCFTACLCPPRICHPRQDDKI